MASSHTLEQAIRVGLRYIDLTHTFLHWTYVADPSAPRLEVVETRQLGTARRFVIERDMSACITLLQDLTGTRKALHMARFPYPPPGCVDSYDAVFGGQVEFDTLRATLLIDPTMLTASLPHANAMAAHLAEEQCRRLLEGHDAGRGLTGRVRRLLLAEPGQLPALPRTASACGMSVRTLRRRLAAEGTSYRKVLEGVRRDLALRYLESTSLSLGEISSRLGYGDAAAFCHAFRRWTGHSPGTWRRESQRT